MIPNMAAMGQRSQAEPSAFDLFGDIFGAILGSTCRPRPEDCCSCRDDGELLTAAWRRTIDSDDADVPKLVGQPGGSGGSGSDAQASRGVPPVLQVPPEFDFVRLDKYPEGSDAAWRTPEEQQKLLQMCLRNFARSLLRGIRMSVLLDDGRTLLTEASLDSELTHLVLHMPNVQCPVALRCIEKICSPDEVTAGAVVTTNQAYLDERCTTLVLRGGQFLTFVFEVSRSREYFEMCLKVIILAKGGCSSLGAGDTQSEPSSPGTSHKSQAPASEPSNTGSVKGGSAEAKPTFPELHPEETSITSPEPVG